MAKAIVVNSCLIMGSTNWTTSSKCNTERSLLIPLAGKGFHEFHVKFDAARKKGETMTKSMVKDRGKQAQQRSRSASPRTYKKKYWQYDDN